MSTAISTNSKKVYLSTQDSGVSLFPKRKILSFAQVRIDAEKFRQAAGKSHLIVAKAA